MNKKDKPNPDAFRPKWFLLLFGVLGAAIFVAVLVTALMGMRIIETNVPLQDAGSIVRGYKILAAGMVVSSFSQSSRYGLSY